jgi:exosortase/archaeosortase family protein
LAAWIGFCDDRVRTIPFGWPAAAAILLWSLAAPLPPGTYARLSSHLQSGVTASVMHALHLLGIAAYRQGNVIELARGSVGVSEACSGVRSLISCTAAGLFFSGILLSRPVHRIILIAASPVIALAMNFVRSFILTFVTSRGISIEGAWHDYTGVGIIAVTSVLLAVLAVWLEGKTLQPVPEKFIDCPITYLPRNHRLLVSVIVFGTGLAAFFIWNTRAPPGRAARTPDLATLLPAVPPDWRTIPDPDMRPYVDILRTDLVTSRSYFLPATEGPALQITIYLAYWKPGQAPVSLVASHTPDACWPGTGWVQSPIPRTHEPLPVGGRMLAEAECRLFVNNDYPQRVWFWHLYGGHPLTYEDPYSFRRLLGLAFRYGFQHDQDQLFVRVSSNRPWQEVASQPIVQKLFENLRPLGL